MGPVPIFKQAAAADATLPHHARRRRRIAGSSCAAVLLGDFFDARSSPVHPSTGETAFAFDEAVKVDGA
jgi:hypothetical protein